MANFSEIVDVVKLLVDDKLAQSHHWLTASKSSTNLHSRQPNVDLFGSNQPKDKKYAQRVQQENERLRELVEQLQAENARLRQ
uniref:Uncharacterized protein n=1 Tax=Ditylenchus dipsaci TaxID=166011 RepID=A0A915EL58_9BILA